MLEQDHAPSSETVEPSTANHSGRMANYIEQSRITEVQNVLYEFYELPFGTGHELPSSKLALSWLSLLSEERK
ncbi:hypothetical protein AAC387_Pa10g0917 [Persea americana]